MLWKYIIYRVIHVTYCSVRQMKITHLSSNVKPKIKWYRSTIVTKYIYFWCTQRSSEILQAVLNFETPQTLKNISITISMERIRKVNNKFPSEMIMNCSWMVLEQFMCSSWTLIHEQFMNYPWTWNGQVHEVGEVHELGVHKFEFMNLWVHELVSSWTTSSWFVHEQFKKMVHGTVLE